MTKINNIPTVHHLHCHTEQRGQVLYFSWRRFPLGTSFILITDFQINYIVFYHFL